MKKKSRKSVVNKAVPVVAPPAPLSIHEQAQIVAEALADLVSQIRGEAQQKKALDRLEEALSKVQPNPDKTKEQANPDKLPEVKAEVPANPDKKEVATKVETEPLLVDWTLLGGRQRKKLMGQLTIDVAKNADSKDRSRTIVATLEKHIEEKHGVRPGVNGVGAVQTLSIRKPGQAKNLVTDHQVWVVQYRLTTSGCYNNWLGTKTVLVPSNVPAAERPAWYRSSIAAVIMAKNNVDITRSNVEIEIVSEKEQKLGWEDLIAPSPDKSAAVETWLVSWVEAQGQPTLSGHEPGYLHDGVTQVTVPQTATSVERDHVFRTTIQDSVLQKCGCSIPLDRLIITGLQAAHRPETALTHSEMVKGVPYGFELWEVRYGADNDNAQWSGHELALVPVNKTPAQRLPWFKRAIQIKLWKTKSQVLASHQIKIYEATDSTTGFQEKFDGTWSESEPADHEDVVDSEIWEVKYRAKYNDGLIKGTMELRLPFGSLPRSRPHDLRFLIRQEINQCEGKVVPLDQIAIVSAKEVTLGYTDPQFTGQLDIAPSQTTHTWVVKAKATLSPGRTWMSYFDVVLDWNLSPAERLVAYKLEAQIVASRDTETDVPLDQIVIVSAETTKGDKDPQFASPATPSIITETIKAKFHTLPHGKSRYQTSGWKEVSVPTLATPFDRVLWCQRAIQEDVYRDQEIKLRFNEIIIESLQVLTPEPVEPKTEVKAQPTKLITADGLEDWIVTYHTEPPAYSTSGSCCVSVPANCLWGERIVRYRQAVQAKIEREEKQHVPADKIIIEHVTIYPIRESKPTEAQPQPGTVGWLRHELDKLPADCTDWKVVMPDSSKLCWIRTFSGSETVELH